MAITSDYFKNRTTSENSKYKLCSVKFAGHYKYFSLEFKKKKKHIFDFNTTRCLVNILVLPTFFPPGFLSL